MDPVALAPLPDPGEPLADQIRQRLERLLGRSLADARLHDHTQAERLTRRLGAAAFTLGRHIYVRPGLARAAEHDPAALALLAHEATHVAQQAPPILDHAGSHPPPATNQNHSRPLAAARPPGTVIQRALDDSGDTEQQALANEAAARAAAAPAGPPAVDPADVADRVYRLLMRDLQNESF